MTARWTTACHWRLQMRRSYRAQMNRPVAAWMNGSSRAPLGPLSTRFPILPRGPWRDHQILACTLLVLPTMSPLSPDSLRSTALTKKDTTARLPWMSRWPSKLCRKTSAFAGRAYSSAGQVASAPYSMVVLQVLQAKLLRWRLKRSAGPWPV